ncbi:MAG: hypothetical protein NTX28_06750 [Novosphingobium sp.]|nr:hypothetical protein [Novosphingobium sp.]
MALQSVTESIRESLRGRYFTNQMIEPEAHSPPVNVRSIRTRVAYFGDTDTLPQLSWIELAFPNSVLSLISETYIADITPSRSDYDLLVVAGKDARRLSRLYRFYKPALQNKPTLAVLDTSTPRERTALLNCGFDDVCDPRTPIPEVRARASALMRRYEMASQKVLTTSISQNLRSVLPHDRSSALSLRQRRILSHLVEKSPQPVAIDTLRFLEGPYKALAYSTVKVMISTLRGVISDEYEILYVSPSSYSLVKAEDI